MSSSVGTSASGSFTCLGSVVLLFQALGRFRTFPSPVSLSSASQTAIPRWFSGIPRTTSPWSSLSVSTTPSLRLSGPPIPFRSSLPWGIGGPAVIRIQVWIKICPFRCRISLGPCHHHCFVCFSDFLFLLLHSAGVSIAVPVPPLFPFSVCSPRPAPAAVGAPHVSPIE